MASKGNGLMRAIERATVKTEASVAIDGNCARKKAERMIVRKKRTFVKKSIWVAPRYSYIVPKAEHIPFSGFFAYKD